MVFSTGKAVPGVFMWAGSVGLTYRHVRDCDTCMGMMEVSELYACTNAQLSCDSMQLGRLSELQQRSCGPARKHNRPHDACRVADKGAARDSKYKDASYVLAC
jgi:hypothetical protein